MPSVMQTTSGISASTASRIEFGGVRRRHVDHARGGAGLGDRLGHGVEHRQVEMGGAAFARRHAAHHLGAVGDRLLGMEGALRAGEALADDLGVLVDQNGHQFASLTACDDLFRGIGEVLRRGDLQTRLLQDLLAELDVGAFQPHHQRHVQVDLARRGDDAFGDHVAAHDAAEDVDQDALDVGILEDDLEGRGHALLGGAAADIEEVGGRGAIELDDVHGGHGEARAVHHAADLAVELDVVQRILGGLGLGGILLVDVAQRLEVLVTLERVVVEVHLGIERDHVARAGDDQRIDLDQRAVELGEGLVETAHHA